MRPCQVQGEEATPRSMGHFSYKLKDVGMAQTEVLTVKKWFVFADKILAGPQLPDTAPTPSTYNALVAQI